MCRRGKVKSIHSDNGTNFAGAATELCESPNWKKVVLDYLSDRNTEWLFNPPAASHMGGVWECQIRSVRKILSVLLNEQKVDDGGLNTLMCLVSRVDNEENTHHYNL